MLADDPFLEKVLGKPVQVLPQVTLSDIVAFVGLEYGLSEEEFRGP